MIAHSIRHPLPSAMRGVCVTFFGLIGVNMEIVKGLFGGMVLQRDRRGVCDGVIAGRTSCVGLVKATVEGRSGKFRFADRVIGRAARGSFTARLSGLPAGGPYEVRLSVTDTASGKRDAMRVSDVWVGDVWIAGGQSNMEGLGLLSGAAKPVRAVRAFYMDDRWGVAKDPIHQLHLAVDAVHRTLMGGAVKPEPVVTGTGPAMSFALAMWRATGVPQGILACGHGGTSMQQWSPAGKTKGSESLYGAMLRRFHKNGGAAAGVIWYQGESDTNPQDYTHYTQRMKRLVSATRRDLKKADLPWVIVQLGRTVGSIGDWTQWNSVQEQQRLLGRSVKGLAAVPAIDLPLDDAIHISAEGCQRLGERMAQAMRVLREGRKAGLPPIEVKRVTVRGVRHREQSEVVVEFENVHGSLRSAGRVTGFTVSDRAHQGNVVFDTSVKGNQVIARCTLPMRMMNGDRWLRYGGGFDPVCGLTDQADRAVPVFGPVAVGRPRAVMSFVTNLQVSELLPSAGKLKELKYPKGMAGLKFTRRTFVGTFCTRHEELAAAGRDALIYFRLPIALDQPMKLRALLGYDGPTKAFCDGREVFFDPNGTNPAIMDQAAIDLGELAAGEHELLVAMGSNGGAAWGIFLRLERMGLTVARIRKGLSESDMPRMLV